MNALIATAQARLAAINAGNGKYSDDEPFIIPGAGFKGANNKLTPRMSTCGRVHATNGRS